MTVCHLNLLIEPHVRTVSGRAPVTLSLPGVLAAAARGEIDSFPALRAHQRHAWHAFLCQLGALALLRAGRADLPSDEAAWRDLIRGLTPEHPDDAPWCLVSSPEKPALLQPPQPGPLMAKLRNRATTPDALDMLVTSRNHDHKVAVMQRAQPEDWLFALVSLQTMEGVLGRGNYGISRMNGGYGNRAAVRISSSGSEGAQIARDIGQLMKVPRAELKSGLVWLMPWDGKQSLRSHDFDALYIEVCRRVRLVDAGAGLTASVGNSSVRRIAEVPGGLTGDPWSPTETEQNGTVKVLTVDASGFHYRRMVRLLGGDKYTPSAMQAVVGTDAKSGLTLLARALTRGQGKTEGYHERRVPISAEVAVMLRGVKATDEVAERGRQRVAIAGAMQGKVLRPALLALFENGPEQIDYKSKGAVGRAEIFLRRFDAHVDADFFPRLWEEFQPGQEDSAARKAWVRALFDFAKHLLAEADAGMSKAVKRRYRARANAEALLAAYARRNEFIAPYLEKAKAHESA